MQEGEGNLRYEIYIDSLFLLHFTLNLYLLQLLNRSLHRPATRKRLLLGAVAAAVGGCAAVLLPIGSGLLKLAACVSADAAVLFLVFRPVGWQAFLRLAERMVWFGCLLGGCFLLLGQIPLFAGLERTMTGLLAVGGILCLIFSGRLAEGEGRGEKICRVELVGKDGGRLVVSAVVDTGNSLREPISGQPVSVLDQECFQKLFKEEPEGFRLIPYHSVGCDRGMMQGYEIAEMVIELEGVRRVCRNPYVGISRTRVAAGAEYQLLLHPAVLSDGKNG